MLRSVIIWILAIALITGCDYIPEVSGEAGVDGTDTHEVGKYYYVKDGSVQFVDLFTVQSWEGTQSKEIKYHADKAPWILNAKYNVTSQLSHAFEIRLSQKTKFEDISYGVPVHRLGQEFTALVDDSGDFTITIQASGVEWWVRVGTE